MNCPRCGGNVPDFLWVADDHPVLVEEPITLSREENIETNTIVIRAEQKVKRQMCSDLFPGRVHAAHLVDGYPLCLPIEAWKNGFLATKDEAKVTCVECKRILDQMNAELAKDRS